MRELPDHRDWPEMYERHINRAGQLYWLLKRSGKVPSLPFPPDPEKTLEQETAVLEQRTRAFFAEWKREILAQRRAAA